MMTVSLLDRLRPHRWPMVLLVTVTFAVYGRILNHGFMINWDDCYYVTDNETAWGFSWEHVRTVFSHCYAGNYAPVQMLSYMVDYTFWGLKAGGFYLDNIVIHALNGVVLYFLVHRLYGKREMALAAAVLFLLHPAQVESVAWISQRKTLLSMLFFLLSWYWYCQYRAAAAGKGRIAYAGAVAAFVLALLAKSVAVVLPIVLLLFDFCFSRGAVRTRVRDKVPFLAIAVIFALISVYSQQPQDDGWMGQGGGITAYHGGSALATFLTMLPVFCRYVGMLVWPVSLSIIYSPPIHRYPDLAVIAAAALLIAVTLAGWRLYRVDRRLGFWMIFPWVGLLPVAQIVPLATLMNDRYLYFPMIGVAVLFAAGLSFLQERAGTVNRRWLYPLFALPVFLLAVLSFQRAGVWRTPVLLWSNAVARNPGNAFAWYKLGEAYFYAVPPLKNEALQAFLRSREIDPNYPLTWYQLGLLYGMLGEYENGYEALETFLQYNPDHVMGLAALGDNLQKSGKYDEAEEAYKRALTLQPDAPQVVSLLGSLAVERGELAQARDYYLRVQAAWHSPESAFQLAGVASRAGHRDEAFPWLEKALQQGFTDRSRLDYGEELTALRDDARFGALVHRYLQKLKVGDS